MTPEEREEIFSPEDIELIERIERQQQIDKAIRDATDTWNQTMDDAILIIQPMREMSRYIESSSFVDTHAYGNIL